MIRVLLVDDDPIVLVRLRNLIDWEKLDCELAGEATNGAEAIREIERTDPHLVITDISMPGINGIDLIHYIEHEGKNRRVIAISAYDDFDYVRKSLKSGAEDYLLKHRLDREVLENAIVEAVSSLEQKEEEGSGLSLQKRQEHLLYASLHNSISEREKEQLRELGLVWTGGLMTMVLCALPSGSLEQEEITYVLMDETIRYFRDYRILPLEKGVWLILVSTSEGNETAADELAAQLKSNLQRIADISLYFVISEQMKDLDDLPRMLRRAMSMLNDCRAKGAPAEVESLSRKDLGEIVRSAVRYIETHYKEKLSLNEIADHLCVSSSYLSRCFKKETGTTIVSYINQVRMKAAREMMDEGVLSLNEIASAIGIQNYNYFYLLFKEIYGETPSEYTKKTRAER